MHSSIGKILNVTNLRKGKSVFIRYIKPSTSFQIERFLHHWQMPISIALNNSKENLATLSDSRDIVSLKINDKAYKFPSIWLRDNCQCSNCFQIQTKSRTIDWEKFNFETKPLNADLDALELTIKWSDEHQSKFSLEWLIERSFTEENRKLFRDKIYRFERVSWGANQFQEYLKKFDYKTLLNEDSVLLQWLEALTRYGVAIITNVPAESNSNKILVERVAFPRQTHYGKEFTVKAKDDAANVAYLSTTLPLHTDLPYYNYAPGVNLLHCVVQSQNKGGESHLVDGLHIANYLKLNEPEAYKILTKTLVDWNDIGNEDGDSFHSLHQAPVICEDEYGDLVRINFSQPQRDSHFNVPLEQIIPWYKAAALFTKLLYSPENLATMKLSEGDILTFDNLRLVHGRSGYTDVVGKERTVIGCYLDWDEIYSRMRVLKKKL